MSSDALLRTGVIGNGGTTLPVAIDTGDCGALSISAPITLPETVNILTPDGSVLQSPPGTDIILAAGKAIVFTQWPFNSVQLLSTATGASRTFTFYGQRKLNL